MTRPARARGPAIVVEEPSARAGPTRSSGPSVPEGVDITKLTTTSRTRRARVATAPALARWRAAEFCGTAKREPPARSTRSGVARLVVRHRAPEQASGGFFASKVAPRVSLESEVGVAVADAATRASRASRAGSSRAARQLRRVATYWSSNDDVGARIDPLRIDLVEPGSAASSRRRPAPRHAHRDGAHRARRSVDGASARTQGRFVAERRGRSSSAERTMRRVAMSRRLADRGGRLGATRAARTRARATRRRRYRACLRGGRGGRVACKPVDDDWTARHRGRMAAREAMTLRHLAADSENGATDKRA